MVSLETIEDEILELEKRDASYAVIERLAWLYIVRKNLSQKPDLISRTGRMQGSEFEEICSDIPVDWLVNIISEHMDMIKQIYPKEYESVVEKIKKARG